MNLPDLLFEYLKDAIYQPETANLDLTQLPEDYQKLGQAMQLIAEWIWEARQMSIKISKGDLSVEKTNTDNVFLGPMKELQSILRHLAWQTQQVAKGDYTQKVDFMGDFSEAFNTMTRQLQERKDALIQEKRNVEKKNAELERAFFLASAFANDTYNMIYIHALNDQSELFQNKSMLHFRETHPSASIFLITKLKEKQFDSLDINHFWDLEINSILDEKIYFHIETYSIEWQQQKAIIHIMSDETSRIMNEKQMIQMAYHDPLTNLYNRRFALEKMRTFMSGNMPFVISSIDIDNLKYCNDHFGHAIGDKYLFESAEVLKTVPGFVCRTGGDEFIIIDTDTTVEAQNNALEKARENLNSLSCDYTKNFSHASYLVNAKTEQELETALNEVDQLMYQNKRKQKESI